MAEGTTDSNWIPRLATNLVGFLSEWKKGPKLTDEEIQNLAQFSVDVAVALKELLPAKVVVVEAAMLPMILVGEGKKQRAVPAQTFALDVESSLSRSAKVVSLAEQVAKIVIANDATGFFPYILLVPIESELVDVYDRYFSRLAMV